MTILSKIIILFLTLIFSVGFLFNASASGTSDSNQTIVQASSPDLNDTLGIKLANLQHALQNETLSFTKNLSLYERGSLSQEQISNIGENHITQLKNISSQFDNLNPSSDFINSVNLFKLSAQQETSSDEYLLDWIKTGNETSKEISDNFLQESFDSEASALRAYVDAENNVLQNAGLQEGEWAKYNVTYNPPDTSSGLNELALLANLSSTGENYMIANIQSIQITIKNVQNDSYVYDSTYYLKNGTEINDDNILGDFAPSDQYMLAIPIHLKIGDVVHGMAFYHDGIVKNMVSIPINGQNINAIELVEDNTDSKGNYTIETHTDNFYDQNTGIALRSIVNISIQSPVLGNTMASTEIEATNFSDNLLSNGQAVPEFGSLVGIIVTISVIGVIGITRRFLIKPYV